MKKRFRGNFQLLIRLFNNKHIMFPTEEIYSDFYFFGYIHVYQNFGLNYLDCAEFVYNFNNPFLLL